MRKRLPTTRNSVTSKVALQGTQWEMYVTVGFYDNRQPGEVFIKVAKHGSIIGGLMDAIAVLISMLLQNDVPFDLVKTKFLGVRFEPMDDAYSSLIDLLVRTVDKVVRDGDGDPAFGYEGKKPC